MFHRQTLYRINWCDRKSVGSKYLCETMESCRVQLDDLDVPDEEDYSVRTFLRVRGKLIQ